MNLYVLVGGLVVVSALGAGGATAQTPVPQPSTERTGSPYDDNPACRDREVASTDPACVIKDGAPPYQFDFNKTTPQPQVPQAPATASPPATPVPSQAEPPARRGY